MRVVNASEKSPHELMIKHLLTQVEKKCTVENRENEQVPAAISYSKNDMLITSFFFFRLCHFASQCLRSLHIKKRQNEYAYQKMPFTQMTRLYNDAKK